MKNKLYQLIKDRMPVSVAVFYVTFGSLWVLVNSSLLSIFSAKSISIPLTYSLASLVFIGITAFLLYYLLNHTHKPSPVRPALAIPNAIKQKSKEFYFFVVCSVLIFVIPLMNYGVLLLYTPKIKTETYDSLHSIANIKAQQLDRWVMARTGDAEVLAADQTFAELVYEYQQHNDSDAEKRIAERFDAQIRAYQSTGISLITPQGDYLLHRGEIDQESEKPHQDLIEMSLAAGKSMRSDLYLNQDKHLLMDVIAPVTLKREGQERIIAFTVIHSDLSKRVLASILAWPTSSKSAEALLIKIDADSEDILSYNPKDKNQTAFIHRQAYKDTVYHIAPRLQQGLDYKGKPVFAVQTHLNSTWSFVAQIDQDEVMAQLKTLLLWISGIALLAITLVAIALLLLWRQQLRSHQLEIANKTSERDRLLNRFYEMPFIGMGVCDPATHKWLQANDRLCEILGYTREELLALAWQDMTHPDDIAEYMTYCEQLNQGKVEHFQHEKRYIHKSGKIIISHIEVNGVRKSNNELELLLVAVEDITEQKETEEALRKSEERLSLVIKGSNDGWWDLDLISNKCYHSPSWWSMFGYDAPLSADDPGIWQQLTYPDDIATIKQFIHDMLNSDHTSYQLECQMQHRLGHYLPILTRGFISRDSHGKAIRISGTDTDLSERIKAQTNLKLQEQFNRALLENQADAVIACDANMQLVLFNNVARAWHGLDALCIPAEQWADFYTLYDKEGLLPLHAQDIPLFRAFNGEKIQDECIAIKAHAQEMRYVSCSAAPFSDDEGIKLGAVVIMRDITSMLAREKTLQESEALYREMFDANPNPMWVIDAENQHFLAVNDAAVNHYGWSREEFSAMTLNDIRPADNPYSFSQPHASLKDNGLIYPLDSCHYKKDRTLIDVETTSNPLIFAGRHARLVLVNDVTDRKQAEIEIRTVNRLLLMLTNINQTIVRRLPTIEMFQEACLVAVRDGGFRMAWIGLIEPDGRHIKTMASTGDSGYYIDHLNIDLMTPDYNLPTASALLLGRHSICHDVATISNIKRRELAQENGFRSIVALPLIVNGSVVGNFSLYSSVLGILNQREMDLLDELASDISFSLSVAEVEMERELAEKALRESETLFHTLARSSPVGVFHTNLKGDFLYINQSWFEITGISFQDAMNNGWFSGIYPQDREKITQAWQTTVIEKQPFNQEFRFQRGDASIVWVKGQAAVEQDATGHFLGFVGTVTDITALKVNEENHRMSNAVFENTREGIMVTDVNNRIIMVNRACTDITQYQADEMIGMTPSIVSSGRHDRAFYAEMWHSLKTTGHWQGELWNRRKNGDVYPELLSLSAINNEIGEVTNYVGVFADISSLKSSEEKLEFLAHHDPLTKLPNRLMLLSHLDHAIEVARRDDSQLALLMLDLDRFKNVNDSFGHLAGDELLQQVAQRLTSKLRSVDTITRLGGDEFTVLLGTIASPEDAARVAAGIIKALEAPWSLSNNIEVRIGASIGISLFPGHGETALELLQHADAALYQAKAAGRGCARYFSEKLTQAARDRFNIESRLRLAIQNNELKVYYQPKIDILTGKIIGAEALMRWQDPLDGLMMPTNFISIAEDTGLIRGLGEWVIKETCEQGKRWLDAGITPLKLAVNISAHQLHHTDIFKTLSALLADTGFPPEYLELELTESILMNREAEVVETLNTIRSKGITLAIDDFGTGYSSLAYLKSFPLDVLKIDRSFVADIEHDEDDRAITATIIKIAHTLGMRVVAEGVETAQQLAFLHLHQCDMYQGFLNSQAVSADEFIKLLLVHNQNN